MCLKIRFNEQKYHLLKIKYSPTAEKFYFQRILSLIHFPVTSKDEGLIKYAINEWVANSYLASRNNNVIEKILVTIELINQIIKIIIVDFAGGFDLKKLPYDFNEDPHEVDLMSDEFHKYREINDFCRHGIGLVSTRRLVDTFSLSFIDKNLKSVAWNGIGSVAGTKIVAEKKFDTVANHNRNNFERRMDPRINVFIDANINNQYTGYIIDLSRHGAKLIYFNTNDSNYIESHQKININFQSHMKNKEIIDINAEVQWLSKMIGFYIIGIHFTKFSNSFNNDLESKFLEYYDNILKHPEDMPDVIIIEGE